MYFVHLSENSYSRCVSPSKSHGSICVQAGIVLPELLCAILILRARRSITATHCNRSREKMDGKNVHTYNFAQAALRLIVLSTTEGFVHYLQTKNWHTGTLAYRISLIDRCIHYSFHPRTCNVLFSFINLSQFLSALWKLS